MIRRRVREETRLTCSCGIGPNKLLSKIATDIRKPDGQFAIGSDHTAIQRFIDPLPVRKIPGIGKVQEVEDITPSCPMCTPPQALQRRQRKLELSFSAV